MRWSCVYISINYFWDLSFGCVATGADDITTIESLQFDLATIEAATNKFSADNKLGEGGFGEVYKVWFYVSAFCFKHILVLQY